MYDPYGNANGQNWAREREIFILIQSLLKKMLLKWFESIANSDCCTGPS